VVIVKHKKYSKDPPFDFKSNGGSFNAIGMVNPSKSWQGRQDSNPQPSALELYLKRCLILHLEHIKHIFREIISLTEELHHNFVYSTYVTDFFLPEAEIFLPAN